MPSDKTYDAGIEKIRLEKHWWCDKGEHRCTFLWYDVYIVSRWPFRAKRTLFINHYFYSHFVNKIFVNV